MLALRPATTTSTGTLKVTPVFSFFTSNTVHFISTTNTEEAPSLKENTEGWSDCKPLFTGLDFCTSSSHYTTTTSPEPASFYPLSQDTRSELLSVPPCFCSPSTLWPLGRVKEHLLCVVRGPCHLPYTFAPSFNHLKSRSSVQHT